MSDPRKHHYVPVFYLKQWVGADRRLCEYKKIRSGKIVTRRTFPDGTGYRRDLYRIDELLGPVAQAVERKFMHMVDTEANYALQKLVRGEMSPWTDKMRGAWTRFILSLWFRNPECVATIKQEMLAIWQRTLVEMKNNYNELRDIGDPSTYNEFMARIETAAPYKAALRLLLSVIDNQRIGQIIYKMRWSRVSLATSTIPLLISDRPLDMPHGLGAGSAYIALPIGPKMLFIAAHDDTYEKHIASTDPTEVVKHVNQAIVHQAREFVWGINDGQLRFISNRMSKAPDRVIITDARRQQAIDAVLNVRLERQVRLIS